MKKIVGILMIAALINGCKSSKTASMNPSEGSTMGQDDKGWISLFDGKTTSGWHTYGKSSAGAAWKTSDNTLYLDVTDKDRKNRGDLVTNEEFENFHLKLEWKIAPNGNSGVIFYVHEDTAKYRQTYQTGMEMQVLDNNGHPDAKIIKHRAGDLYDLITVSKETVKPAGEWNQAEIISKDGKLDFYLNGEHTVDTNIWNEDWRTMIANSKFKSMADFGTFKKGHIALQDHGDGVWYRNIMIKKL